MTKKIGDKKVGRVKSTHETDHVQSTEGVFGIGNVKGASGVRSVNRTGAIGSRSPTRLMTLAEREELFKLVNEEAKNLFGKSGLPKEKIEDIQQAVKMAIDSGLIDERHQDSEKKKSPEHEDEDDY